MVRHGTTTVLVGNCSLGTCFGSQLEGTRTHRDCFTRVENIPKSVLRKCVEAVTWQSTGDYLDHFDSIPWAQCRVLSAPFHAAGGGDGAEDSIIREPTEAELRAWKSCWSQAMDQGTWA